MPRRQSKTSKRSAQAARAASALNKLEAARTRIRSARIEEAKAQLFLESEKQHDRSVAWIRRVQREYVKARDATIKAEMDYLRALGLYEPRTEENRPVKLTRSRRRTVRNLSKELSEREHSLIFAPFAGMGKSAKRSAAKQAHTMGKNARVTKRGIFVERPERDIVQPLGALVYDKDAKLWVVKTRKLSKPDKQGVRHRITAQTYLSGGEALEHQQERLRRAFERMSFNPKRERIRFVINGGNVSRWSFTDLYGPYGLFEYLRQYRKTEGALAGFIGGLTLVKFEKDGRGNYTRPVGKLDSLGRTRSLGKTRLNWDSVYKRSKRRGWRRGKRGE